MGIAGLWFRDYNSEGQLTRRLNQTGCLNVIKVLDWAFLDPDPREEPKFRIAYELADHGDLWSVVSWYRRHECVSFRSPSLPTYLPTYLTTPPHSHRSYCWRNRTDSLLVSSSLKRSCGTSSTVWLTRSAIARWGGMMGPSGRTGGRRLCMGI